MCWLGVCKYLKALSRTFWGEPSLSCVLCPPTLIPSSNNMNSLKNPSLTSLCPGATLLVLPKADPSLEGNVADVKSDPSACHQLGQVTVLQNFWVTAGSMEHQHVFRQTWLSWKVLVTVGKQGRWQVIWCLRSHQIIHDVGSLCISTMWLLNFFLLERTFKQELQKWQLGPRGSLTILSCRCLGCLHTGLASSSILQVLTGVRPTTNYFVIFQPGSGQLLSNFVILYHQKTSLW